MHITWHVQSTAMGNSHSRCDRSTPEPDSSTGSWDNLSRTNFRRRIDRTLCSLGVDDRILIQGYSMVPMGWMVLGLVQERGLLVVVESAPELALESALASALELVLESVLELVLALALELVVEWELELEQ